MGLRSPGWYLGKPWHSVCIPTQQCWIPIHRAQTCCRHFMVKLSDDGTFILAGDHMTHVSLDALVSFYQQKPIRPYGELLTQACGQVGVREPQLPARKCQRPPAWNSQGFFCRNGFPLRLVGVAYRMCTGLFQFMNYECGLNLLWAGLFP